MVANGLDQSVNSSMHVHGNKLDLVFAEAGSDLTFSSYKTGTFILHCKLVTATLNIRKLQLEPAAMKIIKNVKFDISQQEL